MKILDCSLRDGGHLNNWSFDIRFAQDLYNCACKSNIDYFEVGYRNSSNKLNLGDFAYCSDDFLFEIFANKSSYCKLTLMAQHGKFSTNDFKNKTETLIDVVRVATYPNSIKESFAECKILKEKGYDVFLNLMAISKYTEDMFKTIYDLPNKDILNYLVISDSFGALTPKQVSEIVKKLISEGFSNIGFHAHNNLQLAFANTLTALDSGCTLVDGTLTGIGRAAGNTPIELLLCNLAKTNSKYNPEIYMDIIQKYYPEKYNSVLTMISGISNIHPNYIDLLNDKFESNNSKILANTKLLAQNAPIEYDKRALIF